MVKYLVEKQEVDLNIKDAEGNTSMHVAALYGNLVILKYLIEDRKCSPMYPGCLSRTPLHCACEGNDNLVMVKYLVEEQRVNLNAKDEQGNTPLNVAAFSGSLSIMTYLIEERYCSLECPGRLCRTPLHNACQHNDNLAMVKYLVEKKGVNMNVKDEQKNTPLNVAAFSGNLAILKYLIDEQNCSSICLGYLSRTLLHNACERNDNVAMVKYLVEGQGVDLNMKDKQGNSPLNVAAFSGSLVILKYLIDEQRCSSMCLGYLSRTLLHNACERNDNIAMVKYLVEEQGAYLNVKDDNDSTALNLATLSGSLTILRYLIEERNCSPTCPDQWGRTLLHDACQINDNLHVVNYLVEELGVDPYTRDDEGNTPLNVAASCGALISLRYLVEDRKCDPACSNYLGRNLLHSACTANSENLAMVKYLVESLRIDPNAMDDCGLSPLDIATTFANDSIAMYLKQKMGIISAPIQYVVPSKSRNCWTPGAGRRFSYFNEKNVSVPLIHPSIKEDLGPMLPEYQIFQKARGDIVFVNLSKLTDFFSHLLKLLLNEPRPEVRRSTPVLGRPIQTILSSSKGSRSFGRLSTPELHELLASNVNKHSSTALFIPNDATPVQECTGISLQQSMEAPASSTVSTISNDRQKPHIISQQHFDSELFDVSDVADQMIPLIDKTKTAAVLDIDWVYFIDSGGQPQFHQILPAFMQNTNLNIVVLRLCDKLSDHPTVQYYENGDCISSSPSLLSNTEIIQGCARATQTTDQEGQSKLLIVGTHRDLEHQCVGETKDDKDRLLLQLLTPSLKNHLLYSSRSGDNVIFPLNAWEPKEADRNVINEMVGAILSAKRNIKAMKIPLRWLVFHQELQARSKELDVNILSSEDYLEIAARLHMSEDINGALQFFAALNVILYYPTVLPNVVFTNPQAILDLISEFVKCITFQTDQHKATEYMHVRAFKQGIISAKLFEDHRTATSSAYKAGLFEPKDVIGLLVHLHLASKYGKNDEYFMPSLLKGLTEDGIHKELSGHPDTVAPIALHFKGRWLKCGEFQTLITKLLTHDEWELALEEPYPICMYSNCILMLYDTCIVTLVDVSSHIEVHIGSDIETCEDVCPKIVSSLLSHLDNEAQWNYICPCEVISQKHLTIRKNSKVMCSRNKTRIIMLSDLGSYPQIWLDDRICEKLTSRKRANTCVTSESTKKRRLSPETAVNCCEEAFNNLYADQGAVLLRDFYDDLCEQLNPENFTAKLYKMRLISECERDEADNDRYILQQRMVKLLKAVERAVKIDKTNFYKFWKVIFDNPTSNALAKRMCPELDM